MFIIKKLFNKLYFVKKVGYCKWTHYRVLMMKLVQNNMEIEEVNFFQ